LEIIMTEPRDNTLEARVDSIKAFTPLPYASLSGDWRFRRVRAKGKAGRSNLLSLRWIKTKRLEVVVGIVVSKKVGKAVVRNKVRRRIREAVRRMDLPAVEAMIVVQPEAASATYAQLVKAIHVAMRKSGLVT
jgi:ribonuclease P protein component